MEVQQKTSDEPQIVACVASTSVEPPPYTAEDAKQFQEKFLDTETVKNVEFNIDLKNAETGEISPEDLEKGEKKEAEEPNEYALMFSEESIRRAFARKVFSLLALLLLKTVLYSALCIYYRPLRQFWNDNLLHVLWGLPVYFATVLIIICCPKIRQRSPWNYILLLLFSSSTTYMIGGICAVFQEESVMIAFAMTTVLVLGLTWFAFQTKWDFTGTGMIVVAFALVLGLTTITSLSYLSIGGRIALSGLAIFFFSICLIIDIQYIVTGDHRYKMSPEEHIFAVVVLYLDIINLFLLILRLAR